MRLIHIARAVFAAFAVISQVDCAASSYPYFAATVSGPVTQQSVQIAISPQDTDLGATGNVYLAAAVGSTVYFDTPLGWVLYTGGAFPPFTQGILATGQIPLFTGLDVTNLAGVDVYAGYGLDQADLINHGKLALVYTFPTAKQPSLFVSPTATTVTAGEQAVFNVIETDATGAAITLGANAFVPGSGIVMRSSDNAVATLNAGSASAVTLTSGSAIITVADTPERTQAATQITVQSPANMTAGSYAGAYSAPYDYGSWWINVDGDGSVSGVAFSYITGEQMTLTGAEKPGGYISANFSPNQMGMQHMGMQPSLGGTFGGTVTDDAGNNGTLTGGGGAGEIAAPSCDDIVAGDYSGTFDGNEDTGNATFTLSAPSQAGALTLSGDFSVDGSDVPFTSEITLPQFQLELDCSSDGVTSSCGSIQADINQGTISGTWDLNGDNGQLTLTKLCSDDRKAANKRTTPGSVIKPSFLHAITSFNAVKPS